MRRFFFFALLLIAQTAASTVFAQTEPKVADSDEAFLEIQKKIPGWEEPKVIGTKEVYPKDLGIVSNNSYRDKMMEYAPEGLVCGYIMRNSWNKNLWGIFLVKDGRKYSMVYKEADKTETRSIKADLAKELEASVNKKIADIQKSVSTPVTVNVYDGIDEVVMVYEGNYAFAVTPDKAVYSWASKMGKYKGINDEIWQQETDQFK